MYMRYMHSRLSSHVFFNTLMGICSICLAPVNIHPSWVLPMYNNNQNKVPLKQALALALLDLPHLVFAGKTASHPFPILVMPCARTFWLRNGAALKCGILLCTVYMPPMPCLD
mmetsp:Transcript_13442/g.21307  ORF Transcript_13442/g.21307 Transcript_13442/m.21307 type:complete len:113 (-) Transcript_13442:853-1191(-)